MNISFKGKNRSVSNLVKMTINQISKILVYIFQMLGVLFNRQRGLVFNVVILNSVIKMHKTCRYQTVCFLAIKFQLVSVIDFFLSRRERIGYGILCLALP